MCQPGPASFWGGLPSRPRGLSSQLGHHRVPAFNQRLLGQVETSPFKLARANQSPARPPVQMRASAGLQRRPPRPCVGDG